MLPKENQQVDRAKVKLFYMIDQFYTQGVRNTHRSTVKFCENFK